MTDAQKRFADEYLIDCNATRAYLAAYPAVKRSETARTNGSRLLAKANIREYIDAELEKLHSAKVADAREVLEYWTAVMRGQTTSEIVVVEGKDDGYSEASAMLKAPDEKERLKAAELLGKHLGMFTDAVKLMGSAAVQIIDDVPEC